ncbi:hypothetical protein PPSIR1_26353 [Plesiocystis pacifica SIR-1]|uniref:DUF2330 domain-containing protein n=1 Tax=Plesiocystis pacifica SIR-1 TaxID=391625 RepID=A6G9Y1_9BACT|nr:DUF2330 domain-containing protein [Plesiocystis pacifica]EDM77306.1 hypothetical protein PPSIR1_26353 [Plesiocystis pacifica SIR-1]
MPPRALRLRRALVPALAAALTLSAPLAARAFCGFYVAGSGEGLTNDATMVVLMRDGQRTVLSMQNSYQGPPEDFAMVVPVPTVLREGDVKTLPDDIFEGIDRLAAPRLVEYWEQDPCGQSGRDFTAVVELSPTANRDAGGISLAGSSRRHGVTIEAQFDVGEYEIAILSAKHSTGLEAWLRQNDYQLPQGAAALLRPYVAQGQKFFVAKVNVDEVKFVDGRAKLSPLRVHYDSETFSLPVRLGMINSSGHQDLVVHILSREVRYEVANYDNVAIPTNLDVVDGTRERFGAFYASLFDHTLAANPNAVVTEYAWGSGSCDPCPVPPLEAKDLASLGADVIPSYAQVFAEARTADGVDPNLLASVGRDFVLTRLHARYSPDSLGEDLVFQAAPALTGGRERWGADNEPETGAQITPGGVNNFQARYAIRHEWQGPIECESPQRGSWGGPWPELSQSSELAVARDTAFADRGAPLSDFVADAAEEQLGSKPLSRHDWAAPEPLARPKSRPQPLGEAGGCASCRIDAGSGRRGHGALAVFLGLCGLLALQRRRR